MKKIFTLALLVLATQFAVAGAFPRKFLIEQFTGETCGYCPGGMYAIVETMQKDSGQFIWIANHAGYQADEYTIPANNTYVSWFGVTGAPSMVLNRKKHTAGGSTAYAFHPGYLPSLNITDARTSDVSIAIDNRYDAATRQLIITVSGQVADTTIKSLKATIWIKENGLVGKQSDYERCFNSWAKFVHPCVMRQVVTATKGDAVQVADGSYAITDTITLSEAWVAERCMVVATVAPDRATVSEVYNTDEAAVVAGTTGGAEYLPEGILMTEKKPSATVAATSAEWTQVDDHTLAVMIQSRTSKTAGSYKAYPVALLYINTTDTALRDNTVYLLDDTHSDIIPGTYNEQTIATEGSELFYAESNTLKNQNAIYNLGNWLIKTASLHVYTRDCMQLVLTTQKGYQVTFTLGEIPEGIEDIPSGTSEHNTKVLENGRLLIRQGERTYTVQGQVVE